MSSNNSESGKEAFNIMGQAAQYFPPTYHFTMEVTFSNQSKTHIMLPPFADEKEAFMTMILPKEKIMDVCKQEIEKKYNVNDVVDVVYSLSYNMKGEAIAMAAQAFGVWNDKQ